MHLLLNQPTIRHSEAGVPVVIGPLAGQAIHPYLGEDCRKKPKILTDLRQTGLPLTILNSLSVRYSLLYFGGITPPILVCKKKIDTPLKPREFLDFLPYFSSKAISIAKSFLFLDRLSCNHLSFSSVNIN